MQRTTIALALVLAVAGAACWSGRGTSQPTPSTMEPRMGPTSPEELGVALDPEGRPYDTTWDVAGDTVETRLLATMHFAAGLVRVMDGNAITVDPAFFADEAADVDFGDTEDFDVSIVWQTSTDEGTTYETVLGVRVDVPGSTVDRWGNFEPAYGTDGGVGGLVSQAVIEQAAARAEELQAGAYFVPEAELDAALDEEVYVGDHDGLPGDDTLIFLNGYGDGGFPMTRGFDADGRLVSLMVWHTRYPWRLAVLDGTPPPDVVRREGELQECLAGTRLIDEYGRCTEG